MAISLWVPNNLITLPSNFQYNDINGNPVMSLYPYDYLVLVGQKVNTLLTNYTTLSTQVAANTSDITDLFVLTSGITAPYVTPEINSQCLLSGCTTQPIDIVLSELLISYCTLLTVLGGASGLVNSITKECSNLNSSPSFSTPGTSMSAITGWVATPTTISDTLVNIWLTLCDARAGITTAINSLTPTCAQVIVNFFATVVNYSTGINVFFDGYSFIPTGFTDNGSYITVKDSSGNVYTSAINIVNLSRNASPLVVPIAGTSLLPTSNYTVTITSNVINTTTSTTCQKTTIQTITNNIGYCPVVNVTPIASGTTYTMIPYITSNVTYRLDVYAASGSTSITNVSFVNPATPQTGTFSGLISKTNYNIITTTTLAGVAPYVCSPIPFLTL